MESLVDQLKNKVGLTQEQAEKAMSCFRSYMIENDLEPDWGEFLESRASKMSDSAKKAFSELFDKTQDLGVKVDDWADKAQDKLDDLAEKAKQTLKDVRNKAADLLADKD